MKSQAIPRPVPPCNKDCPNRKAGCGADCEAWQAYVAERDAIYKLKREQAKQNALTTAKIRAYKERERRKRQESNSILFRNRK